MSAMAAAIDGDEIHLFADAVFYDGNGTVSGFHPKIWKIPGLNAAFMSRGQARAFTYFRDLAELADVKSWDELKECLPLIWQGMDSRMDGVPGDFLLAGFSESNNRPELLYRHTADDDDHLPARDTYIYLRGVASFGCVMEESDDIPTEALRAFEAARRNKADINAFHNGREPVFAHAVGGRLQHAVLTREGSTARMLHAWPDRVGEKIMPEHDVAAAA